MIFDQANEQHQHALDAAFASGYRKGSGEADEHVVAECAALREGRDAADATAFRQGYETAALHACLLAGVIAFWWYVGANIVLPLVGWLT